MFDDVCILFHLRKNFLDKRANCNTERREKMKNVLELKKTSHSRSNAIRTVDSYFVESDMSNHRILQIISKTVRVSFSTKRELTMRTYIHFFSSSSPPVNARLNLNKTKTDK